VGGSAGASAADSAAAEEYLREQLARALRHPSGSARASSGHAHDSLGTDDNALSDPHARAAALGRAVAQAETAAALAAADRATAAAGRRNKERAIRVKPRFFFFSKCRFPFFLSSSRFKSVSSFCLVFYF
jgi:hypothetical protein